MVFLVDLDMNEWRDEYMETAVEFQRNNAPRHSAQQKLRPTGRSEPNVVDFGRVPTDRGASHGGRGSCIWALCADKRHLLHACRQAVGAELLLPTKTLVMPLTVLNIRGSPSPRLSRNADRV
jgi:hypothetical protein